MEIKSEPSVRIRQVGCGFDSPALVPPHIRSKRSNFKLLLYSAQDKDIFWIKNSMSIKVNFVCFLIRKAYVENSFRFEHTDNVVETFF